MKTRLRIGEIRRYKGITQQKLASDVGIAREYLSAVENNKETPSLKLLEKIAKALEVKISDLLKEESA